MKTAIIIGAIVVVLAVGATVYAASSDEKPGVRPKGFGAPSPFFGGDGLAGSATQRSPIYGPVSSGGITGVTFGPSANTPSPSQHGGNVSGESSISNCSVIASAAAAAAAAEGADPATIKKAYDEAKKRCSQGSGIIDTIAGWF